LRRRSARGTEAQHNLHTATYNATGVRLSQSPLVDNVSITENLLVEFTQPSESRLSEAMIDIVFLND